MKARTAACLDVACPTCGAKVSEKCLSQGVRGAPPANKHTAFPHSARWDAWKETEDYRMNYEGKPDVG